MAVILYRSALLGAALTAAAGLALIVPPAAQAASSQTVYALTVNRAHPATHWYVAETTTNADNGIKGESAQNDGDVTAQAQALRDCVNAGVAITDCDNVAVAQNGYVALATDGGYWGDAAGYTTPKAAESEAVTYCVDYGGTTAACTASESVDGNFAGGSAVNAYHWGYFYAGTTAEAILWAVGQLGTAGNCGSVSCDGYCLVFAQLAYGQDSGDWAPGKYAGTAATALNYLEGNDPGYPTDYVKSGDPPGNYVGSLVWFNSSPANYGDGHVGIYLGDGQFISATGITGQDLGGTGTVGEVLVNSISAWSAELGSYAGWTWTPVPSEWPVS
jgi:hypothetical protein